MSKIKCVDLFCGVGGLTHGFVLEGLSVVAGVDVDPMCRYPFEVNNGARFIECDIEKLSSGELNELYEGALVRVLAGCAPCQPFSNYATRYGRQDDKKWGLLYEFSRLTVESIPDVISMENVATVVKHSVFNDFVDTLMRLGYQVSYQVVNSSLYGVPQNRQRMVLLASRHGNIELIPPSKGKTLTVRDAIYHLPKLSAGDSDPDDPLHVACKLSEKNLQRIRASKPGGSWRDWPEHLVADCHRNPSGQTYPSVYGRMEWDKPAPTMTTQCHGYGNGRFGHPEQDRAISLREAAILQSFPKAYDFVPRNGEISFSTLGRLIGNAVPVELGRAIARSIKRHLADALAY